MIGLEAVGSGELNLIFSLFDHGPGKEVSKGVVGDSKFLLDKRDNRGRRILCRTLMGVSCVALILTFDETHAACGQVFDANIGHAAAPASDGHLLSCLGYGSELAALEPDIFRGWHRRFCIHDRIQLIRVLVIDVPQILGVRDHFIDARIDLIEMRTNNVYRVRLSTSPPLLRNELPVPTASEIMLGLHGVAIHCSAANFNFMALY